MFEKPKESLIQIKKGIKNKEKWNSIPWKEIEKFVHKLQLRIYIASKKQNISEMRKMQRILINSQAAKIKAVRSVSQDNRGKKTAGVDGVKSLTGPQRYSLAINLKIDGKASPIKRNWIPKPGKDEMRPLGIPTIKDRAKQKLLLMALEPEWEAKFEPNSYGFRPGRSSQDAIEAIYISINQKSKWVLEADIEKCFDQIDHKTLLKKLDTFPEGENQVASWLKAGILDGNVFEETSDRGTPQGGVISPFLANVALHGFEAHIKEFVTQLKLKGMDGKALPQRTRKSGTSLIRYADDFVILHAEYQAIKQSRIESNVWLKEIGLKLKESKTCESHTLGMRTETEPMKKGFDFLGFNIRQYPIGKYRVRKTKVALQFRTLVMPSKDKVSEHMKKMKDILKEAKKPEAILAKLNPIIIGWARYYHKVVSYKIFKWCDAELFKALLSWTRKIHKKRSRQWQNARYFHSIGTRNWVFGIKKNSEIIRLKNHTDIPIERHIKVRGTESPYNGNWTYWSSRLSKYPTVANNVIALMKKQKGKCNWCKRPFFPGDIIERDHILAKSQGGRNLTNNFQLLHGHCHDQKTQNDR